MILLLDALSVRYFQYSYDPGEFKHTSLLTKRLSSLYNTNFLRDIIVQIDSIVILNLGNIKLNKDIIKEWATEYFPKRLFKSKFSKTAKQLNKLLQNSIVLNYDDLGLALSDLEEQKLIDVNFNYKWISPLRKLIEDSEVIFVGEWTAQYSLMLSEQLKKVKFYRRYFKPYSNEYLGLVEDKDKYVEFYKKFYGNSDSNKNYFSKSYSRYKKFIENPFSGIYLNQSDYNYYFETKDPSFSKKAKVNKIIFVGNKTFIERYLYQKFKDEYYWYDCSENTFKIKPNMDGLVFTSVHKLSQTKLRELLSEISTGKYKRKPVLLLADEWISISPSNDFIIEPEPTSEECKKYFCHFFHEMIYEKLSIQYYKSQEFDSVYMDLCNSGSLSSFFNSIISLAELELFLNKMQLDSDSKTKLLHLDLWYELLRQFSARKNESIKESVLKKNSVEEVEQYVFRRLPNKHFEIIFNSQRIYPDDPDSDGLFYIYTIIKQASYEPIKAEILYGLKTGAPLKNLTKKKINDVDDYDELVSNHRKPIESLSSEAIQNAEDEKEKILKQLEDAKLYGDKDLVGEFEEKLKDINQYIKKGITKYGKRKTEKTLEQKNKTAIDKALKDLKDGIKKRYPHFYTYLNEHIVYNPYAYSYSCIPNEKIHWIME